MVIIRLCRLDKPEGMSLIVARASFPFNNSLSYRFVLAQFSEDKPHPNECILGSVSISSCSIVAHSHCNYPVGSVLTHDQVAIPGSGKY
jgi:hypothetical protein